MLLVSITIAYIKHSETEDFILGKEEKYNTQFISSTKFRL